MERTAVAVRTEDLAREIGAYLARDPENTLVSLAEISGVNARNLRAILSGRYRTTSIWTADRVMTALGTHYSFLEPVKDGRSGTGTKRSQTTTCVPRSAVRLATAGRDRSQGALHDPGRSCAERAPARQRQRSRTTLQTLLDAGFVSGGELIYASLRGRAGAGAVTFVARIVETGAVEIVDDGAAGQLNGDQFQTVSAAISVLYGRPDGGWKNWKIERDGKQIRLEQVRAAYDATAAESTAAAA